MARGPGDPGDGGEGAPEALVAFRAPTIPPRPAPVPGAGWRDAPVATTPVRRPAPTEGAARDPEAPRSAGPAPAARRAPDAAQGAGATAVAVRAPVLARDMPAGPVQVMSWSCQALPDDMPQGLGLTYWFDAAPAGEPYPVNVRFTGRRISGPDFPGPADTFEEVARLDRVVPGSGRISVTARVPQVAAGQWQVRARPVVTGSSRGPVQAAAPSALPAGTADGATAYLPVVNVRAPGVRVGAWPALVGTGVVAALIVQGLLAAHRGLSAWWLLLISAIASLAGLGGAKLYYLLSHRGERRGPATQGLSVQGFSIVTLAVLIAGSRLAGLPIGAVLDVTVPGLLLGLTIGRWGCFFGGCCVGRPTASRWGVWSSDRSVGVRRIPVQLMESGWAAVTALASLLLVLLSTPRIGGLVFLAGFAGYTFGRQLLFPLRQIPRKTSHGRTLTLAVSGLLTLVAGVLLAVT